MVRFIIAVSLVIALLPAAAIQAKDDDAPGLIAVSAGESVALVDSLTGAVRSIPAGPVAWLFPAPGGTLFAPDLVNGTTTVIDLGALAVRERLEGVTMPHFGDLPDRYLVVAHQLLIMSYPERALMNRFEIDFRNPWQVAVIADNTVLLVLERDPNGAGQTSMVGVNLSDGRLVYRRPLGGDVRHFGLSPSLGLIALADASGGQVVFADPGTLSPQATFAVAGSPVDLVFVDGGSTLAVASELPDGGGELVLWKVKSEKKKGLVIKKEWHIALDGVPVRVAASPDGKLIAVGLVDSRLQIIDVGSKTPVQAAVLPAAPRDIVWCDPSFAGPLLPAWTDNEPPTLEFEGRSDTKGVLPP